MTAARLRLDKWLWFARLCKSRALAQELIARGQVWRDGAAVEKAAATVSVGDELEIVFGPVRRSVVVRALASRRGPAAQALYDESQPPQRLPPADAAPPLRSRYRPLT